MVDAGRHRSDRDRGAVGWSVAAFVATVLPLGLAAWLPVASEVTTDSSGVTVEARRTLLAGEGSSILFVLAVPALVAAVPLITCRTGRAQTARITAAVTLGVCVALGAMTVGVAYLPAAALALVAAVRGRQDPAPTPPPPPPLTPPAAPGPRPV